MSFAEVKTAIEELTDQERIQLEMYLKARNMVTSPTYREEMLRRAKEMQAGHSYSSADVKQMISIISKTES